MTYFLKQPYFITTYTIDLPTKNTNILHLDEPLCMNSSSISFKKMLNKKDKRSPCLTPNVHSTELVKTCSDLLSQHDVTRDLTAVYIERILFRMIPLSSNLINFDHKLSLTT